MAVNLKSPSEAVRGAASRSRSAVESSPELLDGSSASVDATWLAELSLPRWARPLRVAVLLFTDSVAIVGACAVRLKSILGLLRAKFFVQELLSGLLVPMTMFPAPIREVLGYLPFEHIAYTPLRIYLGKLNGAEIVEALAAQIFWVVALGAFGAWFWNRMALRITIHGG